MSGRLGRLVLTVGIKGSAVLMMDHFVLRIVDLRGNLRDHSFFIGRKLAICILLRLDV